MLFDIDKNKLFELYDKPASYQFTAVELDIIRQAIPKSSFKVKYAIYKTFSKQNFYIGFFIDTIPNAPRRSGIENKWDFICERNISDFEYFEMINNLGTNNRRFKVWYYRTIEKLIEEDSWYDVETPQKFIKICMEKGYTAPTQTQINFK